MCYSAQLKAEFATYERYGGHLNIHAFVDLYGHRFDFPIYVARALDFWFDDLAGEDAARIREMVDRYKRQKVEEWTQELFKQRRRLVDAERVLVSDAPEKKLEKAGNERRIASNKVERLMTWIEDAKRTQRESRDGRIYPNYFAPVLVEIDGQRQILPMRYGCRLAGKPASYDRKYPGTYNARRDNLEGFWKGAFGKTHGIMIATAFFEHVERDGQDTVLKFSPNNGQDMLVACLWSRWTKDGEPDLLSFAAITDEPPVEVAAAGHDRCIIPIKPENLDAWLKGGSPEDMYKLLDDRERPYYEHKLAA